MSLVSRPLRLRLAASFRGAYDLHLSLYETFKSQRSMPPFRWRKTRKNFIKSPFPCQPQSVSFFSNSFFGVFPASFRSRKTGWNFSKSTVPRQPPIERFLIFLSEALSSTLGLSETSYALTGMSTIAKSAPPSQQRTAFFTKKFWLGKQKQLGYHVTV